GLGIDVGPEGVTPGEFPTLTSAVRSGNTVRVQGSLQKKPNTTYVIEFFGNSVPDPSGYGEGEFYLGNTVVMTDSTGSASFDVTLNALYGSYVTATFTDTAPDGYTGEFSADLAISGGGTGNAVVSGFVWNDSNFNGIQDAGEVGLANVTVYLYTVAGSLVSTTTTATDGSYSFSGVTPGDYYLQFVAPSGYSFSRPYQADE